MPLRMVRGSEAAMDAAAAAEEDEGAPPPPPWLLLLAAVVKGLAPLSAAAPPCALPAGDRSDLT